MDLNDLIPNNNSDWSIDKDTLFYKKYLKIPICYIDSESDIIFISLDHRIHKAVSLLINYFISKDLEFYLCYPEIFNPKGVMYYKEKVIYHYFITYLKKNFRKEFDKIGFDLIGNLCKWVDREDCFDLMKDVYDEVKNKANRSWQDWHSGKGTIIFEYSEDIREDYNALWREIQINTIIK